MDPIKIKELPYRSEIEFADNIVIESLDNPSIPTSRTGLDAVKRLFSGELSTQSAGFVSGEEVVLALTELTESLNNICTWNQRMSDLLTIRIKDFIDLKYDCCLVNSSASDYPESIKDSEQNAYLFTNRNEKYGIQILIGALTGYQFTRRMNNGTVTEWTAVQGNVSYYATFDINPRTGELIMHTDPGYSGSNFSIKEGNLIVTI